MLSLVSAGGSPALAPDLREGATGAAPPHRGRRLAGRGHRVDNDTDQCKRSLLEGPGTVVPRISPGRAGYGCCSTFTPCRRGTSCWRSRSPAGRRTLADRGHPVGQASGLAACTPRAGWGRHARVSWQCSEFGWTAGAKGLITLAEELRESTGSVLTCCGTADGMSWAPPSCCLTGLRCPDRARCRGLGDGRGRAPEPRRSRGTRGALQPQAVEGLLGGVRCGIPPATPARQARCPAVCAVPTRSCRAWRG